MLWRRRHSLTRVVAQSVRSATGVGRFQHKPKADLTHLNRSLYWRSRMDLNKHYTIWRGTSLNYLIYVLALECAWKCLQQEERTLQPFIEKSILWLHTVNSTPRSSLSLCIYMCVYSSSYFNRISILMPASRQVWYCSTACMDKRYWRGQTRHTLHVSTHNIQLRHTLHTSEQDIPATLCVHDKTQHSNTGRRCRTGRAVT